MTDDPVNTGENRQPGAFVKGDPRINRRGRPRVPKSAKELNKLIDDIAAETVTNPTTGEQVERLRAMLRSMMTGKETGGKVHILDRRYGKVVDKLDVETKGETRVIIEYADAKSDTAETTHGADPDQDAAQEA